MRPAAMTRPSLRTLLLSLSVLVAAIAISGCGESGIEVSSKDPLQPGAKIFNERCGGCHTFDAAGTEGSATKPNDVEIKDGPNFNVRKENYADVVYAIENGGFSSGPMPQNIVTGREAKIVACFVAKYSGKNAEREESPGQQPVEGAGTDNCEQQFASK
jgi:mono/diheme cytochrome c family protein